MRQDVTTHSENNYARGLKNADVTYLTDSVYPLGLMKDRRFIS